MELQAGVVIEPELAWTKAMRYETQLIVFKPQGVEMVNIAAAVRRIWRRIPLRPLSGRNVVDCTQIIKRARYPESVIEAGYPVNVAKRKWIAQFSLYFQIAVQY